MTNWKAGLIHLGISIPVVFVAATAMALVWFPPPLFMAAGGGELILILAGVDIMIGPVLTLLIYKSGKRTLTFDLTVIGVVQIAALLYGAYSIYLARPAYVVFSVSQFEVVSAADIPAEEQVKAVLPVFKHSPIGRFRVVVARLPVNADEQQRIFFASLVGHDLSHFPQHYVSYESGSRTIAERAQSIGVLKLLNPEREGQIENWVRKTGKTAAAVGFVPVRAVKRDFAALIDLETGELLDFGAFNPW